MNLFRDTTAPKEEEADVVYEEVRLAVLQRLRDAVRREDSSAAKEWANIYKLIEDAGYCTECG